MNSIADSFGKEIKNKVFLESENTPQSLLQIQDFIYGIGFYTEIIIIQEDRLRRNFLVPLIRICLPLMKKVLTPLSKSVL